MLTSLCMPSWEPSMRARWQSPAASAFAHARSFVIGTCPKCKYEDARGDQVGCPLVCLAPACSPDPPFHAPPA